MNRLSVTDQLNFITASRARLTVLDLAASYCFETGHSRVSVGVEVKVHKVERNAKKFNSVHSHLKLRFGKDQKDQKDKKVCSAVVRTNLNTHLMRKHSEMF